MDIAVDLVRQHLIDPEICIRCNTCEETCPIDAITHDARNYVVDAAKCNACLACIGPCPTGAIDNWRVVPRGAAYATASQLEWDLLPPADAALEAAAASAGAVAGASGAGGGAVPASAADAGATQVADTGASSRVPPRSAPRPALNLYTIHSPIRATVVGNFRITDPAAASDTRHIVLDFGTTPFPVLEGQSIGVIPPGRDAQGRAHVARQYSVASPRDGERPGYNNLSLTVKRVTAGHDGAPLKGLCSNWLCDLEKGATVDVIGPFGGTFLMPDDPDAHLVMVCTGTGSAPMRAMTERRRRMRAAGTPARGTLTLFFGARSEAELPYFGPLTRLPGDFIDTRFAYSRMPGVDRRYVQDRMREHAKRLGELLADARTHVYVCGLRGMEEGVLEALAQAARATGLDWEGLREEMKATGRLHLETY